MVSIKLTKYKEENFKTVKIEKKKNGKKKIKTKKKRQTHNAPMPDGKAKTYKVKRR